MLDEIGQALIDAEIEPGTEPKLRLTEAAKSKYSYLKQVAKAIETGSKEDLEELPILTEEPYAPFFYFSTDKSGEQKQYAKSLDPDGLLLCYLKQL